jgi:hypothetical protein
LELYRPASRDEEAMIEALINTVCLLIVAWACAVHLNNLKPAHAHCEKWGYALTLAGALGSAAEWWLPAETWHAETILAIGLALIALSSTRERVRAVWNRLTDTARKVSL